ncbi:MAG: hypothetical protein OES39_01090 [Desulfobulbaceae bacterium]|nr:hypothetical protein [Desulfobulbaceae bacterium]MDH3865664.1 hypothetical protein [Desulfobulbaceae bacterium]
MTEAKSLILLIISIVAFSYFMIPMGVIKMTGTGSILWIIAIVAFGYFMLREGGVCSDGKHEHDHETDKEKFGGGCCG